MKKMKFGLVLTGLLLGLGSATPPVPVSAVDYVSPPVSYLEDTIVMHYFRSDGDYTGWNLWLWPTGGNGADHDGNYENQELIGDKAWAWQDHPVSEFDPDGYNYIIRKGSWEKQSGDLRVNYADLTYDATNKRYDVYFVDMESVYYSTPTEALAPKITSASFTSITQIALETSHQAASYSLYVKGNEVAVATGSLTSTYQAAKFIWTATLTLPAEFTPDLAQAYEILVNFTGIVDTARRSVALNALFDDQVFIDTLTYDGTDLGLTYTPTASTFKLWAPTSSDVKLRIYDVGTPVAIDPVKGNDTKVEVPMVRGEKGVWSITMSGDYVNKYYTYVVTNAVYQAKETVDPYARAAGVNGLRGMIIDLDMTDPEGWDEVTLPEISPTELAVYELHVADLTSDVTWNGQEANRKKYLGLIEEGTTYTSGTTTVTTGFDHIKELGVNAVQILPFFDQDNDEVDVSFNWGYNPQNYNVLEGAYSADPHDGALRVTEMKQVVQAYAASGIRIIMDVVYNHVSNPTKNPLNIAVPQYYFRYTPDGSISNNSGVGNDTASERKMFHNFMLDSTSFLAEEYKLGGYRFDLMGLHDTATMNDLTAQIQTRDSDFVVYGEPWDMLKPASMQGEPFDPASHLNQTKMPNVGGFNDQMRDGVKGSVFSTTSKGWVQSAAPSTEMLLDTVNGLKGITTGSTTDPKQVVNYVACHDNNTLYDKLVISSAVDGIDEATLRRRNVQADAFVLLGQGVSFIHAGSEILRSKPNDDPLTMETSPFDHNSYKSSYEVNDIEWDRKVTYLAEYELYRQMIAFKTGIPLFQLATRAEIDAKVTVNRGDQVGLTNATMVYDLVDGDEQYKIIFHGAAPRIRMDLSGYSVVLDSSGTLVTGTLGATDTRIQTNSVLILALGDGSVTSIPGSSDPGSSDPGTSTTRGGCGGAIIGTGSAIGFSLILVGLLALKKKKLA